MDREEAISKLKVLQDSLDPEAAHGDADDIICELLQSLGYSDVIEEFNKVEKWYA